MSCQIRQQILSRARKNRTLTIAMLLMLAVTAVCYAQVSQPTPAQERTQILADWEALKYGMFIHFGMSTFAGDEYGWKTAQPTDYNPTNLDVDQWVRTAKDSGMKFALLTTKHCYGHALWPTKAGGPSIESSPVKVDVVRQFVDACKKHDIKPGFYYLLGWDRANQQFATPADYETFCRKQVIELLTDYGPILEIWLDIPWDMGTETDRVLADMYTLVKKLQPNCLVVLNQGYMNGSRVEVRDKTYFEKQVGGKVALWPRDLCNGECTPPPATGHNPKMAYEGKTYYMPMETDDILGRLWFYNPDDAMKTIPTLHKLYQSTVGRNANLVLDVGPDQTGRIPASTVKRLMELKNAIENPTTVPVNILIGKKATASNVYQNEAEFTPDKLTDEDSRNRWATDGDQKSAWIEFDLGSEMTFNSAVATEDWNRIEQFAIEVPDGKGGWKAVYIGEKMGGEGPTLKFASVTANKVRLHILKAVAGPTIWDFEVYNKK